MVNKNKLKIMKISKFKNFIKMNEAEQSEFRKLITSIIENDFDTFKSYIDGGSLDDNMGVLKWLCEYSRIEMLDFLKDSGYSFSDKKWDDAEQWVKHSVRITDKDRDIILDYIKNKRF